MKEQILKLREEGLTYNQIVKILGCAKSTIAYHCNKTSKIRAIQLARQDPNRYLIKRTNVFRSRRVLRKSVDSFHRCTGRKFGYNDVINKFGLETKCYLTGRSIHLYENEYEFDHIVPVGKGGSNELDNLGITIPSANRSKVNLLLEEYLELCKEVLENFGYKITKE